MQKVEARELLYDPIPRPDVKFPPIARPTQRDEDSKKLEDVGEKADVEDLLSNLVF